MGFLSWLRSVFGARSAVVNDYKTDYAKFRNDYKTIKDPLDVLKKSAEQDKTKAEMYYLQRITMLEDELLHPLARMYAVTPRYESRKAVLQKYEELYQELLAHPTTEVVAKLHVYLADAAQKIPKEIKRIQKDRLERKS